MGDLNSEGYDHIVIGSEADNTLAMKGEAVRIYCGLDGSTTIHGGSTWNFQAWFRDPPAGGAGFNLSDGLMIDFLN